MGTSADTPDPSFFFFAAAAWTDGPAGERDTRPAEAGDVVDVVTAEGFLALEVAMTAPVTMAG